jgi:hypothetical protein
MYQVETKVLKSSRQAEHRKGFRTVSFFNLLTMKKMELVTNCEPVRIFKTIFKLILTLSPNKAWQCFSAVLRSDVAVKVSIQIINAFVEMRKLIANHSGLLQRMDGIERKQLETDQKFEKVFKALESKDLIPTQGVFFDGQVFDAYELASKIIRSAKKNFVLIDNYIDESTLTHLSKKNKSGKGAFY